MVGADVSLMMDVSASISWNALALSGSCAALDRMDCKR